MTQQQDNNSIWLTILCLLVIGLLQARSQSTWDAFFGASAGVIDNEFAISTDITGAVGPATGRVSYFMSDTQDIISMSIGPKAEINDKMQVLVLFGTEVNNSHTPKISVQSWFKLNDDTSILIGGESVDNSVFWNSGVQLRLASKPVWNDDF